jgi:L-iditol 2-dehydrogenase
MTARKMMKVAVYYANDDIRIEERPVPALNEGDILVQTEVCGLCAGETMEWYLASRAPKVLGHEPTGIIVEAGSEVEKFKVGDRVFAHHHVPCMSCHYCHRGRYTLCERFSRTNLDPGGFAEFFRVPAENVQHDTHLLPDSVSFEDGTVIEPMACALKGIKQTPIHPGDTVAFVGLGFIGMCYLQLINLFPVGKIFLFDLSDWRLEKAQSTVPGIPINPRTNDAVSVLKDQNLGMGADAVFITAPTIAAWELGYSLCERGGQVHFGAPPPPGEVWPVDAKAFYFNEIQTNTTYSANHIDTRSVVDLLASGRVNASPLITHRFGLDGVEDAFRLLLKADQSLKSLIYPAGV